MSTPNSEKLPPARKRTTIIDLPSELLLKLFGYLPTVNSLRDAILAHPAFYNAFSNWPNSASTSVLRNELLQDTYVHAIVDWKLSDRRDALPPFEDVDVHNIASYVDMVCRYRDDALHTRVSLGEAFAISARASQVWDLCYTLIEDCAYAKDQRFVALWESIRVRPPSISECVRIQQAIYLYQILAHLCRHLFFTDELNQRYLLDCQDKVTELQKCVVGTLMAPWELYQVIGVQAYFRRAMHGLEKHRHLSERIMPILLLLGIGFMHHVLCRCDWADLDRHMALCDRLALEQRPHAFGMVLSRGIKNSWTLQEPKQYDDYKSFWEGDYLGYESWKRLEILQLAHYENGSDWDDDFGQRLTELEGQLDLWSAALWNEDRWGEIIESIDGDWESVKIHWDPMTVGLQAMMYPGLLDKALRRVPPRSAS